jgi:protein ImuB
MRRVISLFLPTFATDRLRRERPADAPPEAPLVTATREGQRRILAAADANSRAVGLDAGMTVAHARALVPDLVLAEAEPERDAEVLQRLGVWALKRYSPLVAVDPPDGLWIDATGCAHLFGGEERMLTDLLARLQRSGFRATAAIAGTTGAAHALARFAGPLAVLPEGGERRAMAPLPLTALRLRPETLSGLRRLGFETAGDLYDVPRAPLVRRFGPEPMRRLDQALGLSAEPLDFLAPPELSRARAGFVEPIGTAEQLLTAIRDLAQALCRDLLVAGLGARRLDLAFHRVDGDVQALRIGTAAPSRDPAHLARLLSDRLDRVDPGFGVEIMELTASLAEPLDARQLASRLSEGRSGGERRSGDLAGLVDTLANRLGAARLYRLAPVESDVPERSCRVVPPLAPAVGSSWPEGWPRPTRLLTPPEPVETMALLPDHPPVQFTWRGRRHRIRAADGPERIFGEWWRGDGETHAVRDYFQVEDEKGSRFWLYRSGDGLDPGTGSQRWFIQGIFG